MLRVGITGGIGSGKSTVCRIFEQLNVPVFHADDEAKLLYQNSEMLRNALKKRFGENVYKNNVLNREYLAGLVFNNPQALSDLNALVHPLVNEQFEQWCSQHSDSPYILKEAAILFESGSASGLDFVIGVIAPAEVRIQRTMARDGISREAVQKRIDNQMNQDELSALCDFAITNDGNTELIPQVLKLHKRLKALSEASD